MTEQRIKTDGLRLDMYVSRLDRPWVETPFLFQGFTLERDEDLQTLRSLCREVVVDTERSRVQVRAGDTARRRPEPSRTSKPAFLEAVKSAARTRGRGHRMVKRLFQDVRLGRSVDTEEAQAVVAEMVDNITRDADASLWITNLKNRDEYNSLHCLNVCVLTLAYCRYLGYEREELERIGLGAVLHDVGKARVPREILNKPGRLTDEEFAVMKRHTLDGYEMLSSTGSLSDLTLRIVRSHHERVAGQGYPDGLAGQDILEPVLAVGIADAYDALTSDRPYKDGLSAEKALGILHKEAPEEFGTELMEGFIRCVGISPIGSLVELDSGALGLVISAEPANRLFPRVLLVRSADGQTMEDRRILDLAARQETARVRRVVQPREVGVDVQAVMLMESGLARAGSLPVDLPGVAGQ